MARSWVICCACNGAAPLEEELEEEDLSSLDIFAVDLRSQRVLPGGDSDMGGALVMSLSSV